VVSEAECLPRKELFESWAVASRVCRRVRGRPILDLAAGHGLVPWLLLLLDPSAPGARCVDRRKPPSAERLEAALVARWPRLAGKVRWEHGARGDLRRVAVSPEELVVAVHACGSLTDRVLDAALAARAAVAVLPCCHGGALERRDTAGLEAWMEGSLAVDAVRALRLRAAGYRVHLQKIPEAITPQNRLIVGVPAAPVAEAPPPAGGRAPHTGEARVSGQPREPSLGQRESVAAWAARIVARSLPRPTRELLVEQGDVGVGRVLRIEPRFDLRPGAHVAFPV
jgi:hypothetical protein